FAGFGQSGQRVVGALDVGGVMLAVVKFVDLSRNVRFKRSVVIVQVGQRVFGHEIPSLLLDIQMWVKSGSHGAGRPVLPSAGRLLAAPSGARVSSQVSTSGPRTTAWSGASSAPAASADSAGRTARTRRRSPCEASSFDVSSGSRMGCGPVMVR